MTTINAQTVVIDVCKLHLTVRKLVKLVENMSYSSIIIYVYNWFQSANILRKQLRKSSQFHVRLNFILSLLISIQNGTNATASEIRQLSTLPMYNSAYAIRANNLQKKNLFLHIKTVSLTYVLCVFFKIEPQC